MARHFTVTLTSGTNIGPYTIYHTSSTNGNEALLYGTTNQATGLTLAQVQGGVLITVPDNATSVIFYNTNGLLIKNCPTNIVEYPLTPSGTPVATPNPTPLPTNGATPQPTPNPSATPNATPNATPLPTDGSTPQPTPNPSATPNATQMPTYTPTPIPSATPNATPAPTPNATPAPSPSPTDAGGPPQFSDAQLDKSVCITNTNTVTQTGTVTLTERTEFRVIAEAYSEDLEENYLVQGELYINGIEISADAEFTYDDVIAENDTIEVIGPWTTIPAGVYNYTWEVTTEGITGDGCASFDHRSA